MEISLVRKLQLLFFLIHAGNACIGPFQAVYFSDRKLTFTQIGIAFAVGALVSMLAQPVWGVLSDRYWNKRKTLFITLIASMLIVLFFVKAGSFIPVLLLIVVSSLFMSGVSPILDAYAYDVAESGKGLSYSHFRFMASAAFGLTNLALGYVIRARGINITFFIYVVLILAGILLLYTMKYDGMPKKNEYVVSKPFNSHLNPRLLLFFASVFLMNASILGGANYMNELVKHTRGDVSHLGLVWFITCVVEVITFYFAARMISALGMLKVYYLSILLYALKFVLDFLSPSPTLIILVQVVEGVAFTLFLTSGLEYLNANTQPEVRASMMSLYAACGGLGTFAASLAGGVLLNTVNPSQLYGILAVICIAALVLSFGLRSESKTGDISLPQ